MRGSTAKRGGRGLKAVVATVTGLAVLGIPTMAQALPATEPDYVPPATAPPAADLVLEGSVESTGYEGVRRVTVKLTARNIGDKAAGPFKVLVESSPYHWHDGQRVPSHVVYISGLEAGKTSNYYISAYFARVDCVRVVGTVDSGKQVFEKNENNNVRYVRWQESAYACG